MILVDANLLIYAYNKAAPQHVAARTWLENALNGEEPLVLPWTVIHAFLRLLTAGRAVPHPAAMSDVIAVVDGWLALPHVHVIEAGPTHWQTLRGVLLDSGARGDLVMDAHLAALAQEHDATLCTTDRDFARFAGLRVVNPLRT